MFRPSWIKGNAPHEGLVTTNGAPVPADAVSRDEIGEYNGRPQYIVNRPKDI